MQRSASTLTMISNFIMKLNSIYDRSFEHYDSSSRFTHGHVLTAADWLESCISLFIFQCDFSSSTRVYSIMKLKQAR